jgi:hypothetical protein
VSLWLLLAVNSITLTLSDEDAARDRGLERMAASLYEALG